MNLRLLRRASGRALVVAAMAGGLLGGVATAASATPTNTWYVAVGGTDSGNNCSVKTNPCATIDYALSEQAGEAVTGTIKVAAGTYTQQVTVEPANSGVTIKGKGATTIIEPPSTGLVSDSDTDTSYPQYYVVEVAPGVTGVSLKDFAINGLNAGNFLDNDGYGCGQSFNGIYVHEADATISTVDVTGADLPGDLFGCQGGNGIYVNSAPGNPSDVSISGANLTATPETSITKATLPAGTYSNDVLPVKAIPAGWNGGSVFVGGYALSATKDGNDTKAILISGTTPATVANKSTINYTPYSSAYDKNGIACDDAETTCSISTSVVQGDGPQNSIAQNGILGWGTGSLTASGNTVTDNTWTGGGGAGNAASGILVLNGDTYNVENNTVNNNDVNIYAGLVQAYGIVAPSQGTWTITGNTVSNATDDGENVGADGYGVGVQLDSTTNNVQVTDNLVTGSPLVNVLLSGVTGATIGGSGAGNTVSGASLGAGIVVGGPGTECEAVYGNSCSPGAGNPDQFSSTNNTIEDNSVAGNGAGVIVEGNYDPSLVGPADPQAAYSNTFTGNTWDDNLFANAADFSGYGDPGEGGTAILNSYSGNTTVVDSQQLSCNPTEGGSPSGDVLLGGTSVANVNLSGTDASTTNSFSNVSQYEGVTDGGAYIVPGTVVASVNSTTDLTLSQSAAAPDTGDTLYFGEFWAC